MRPPKPTPKQPLPQHADPAVERLSYAPYNFVPLPDAVMPAPVGQDSNPATPRPWESHDRFVPGTFSGWFGLTITAASPLYVRCAPPAEHAAEERTNRNRHRQDFFHLGDPEKPALPGSSLRGMTRTLVELVSFAKLSPGFFSDRRLIYRAVGDVTSLGVGYRRQVLGDNHARPPRLEFDYPSPLLRAGYLRKRGPDWYIQPASEVNGETFAHVEYEAAKVGQHEPKQNYNRGDVIDVFVRPPAARSTPSRNSPNLVLRLAHIKDAEDLIRARGDAKAPHGFVRGKIVRSGHMGGQSEKHMHCVVYEPDHDSVPIPIGRELWDRYEDDRDLTRGIPTRKLERDGDPLFYLTDAQGTLLFFGPTMMFRLPYPYSVSDFVPPHLRDPGVIDLAEAIFGVVRGKTAIKGRVFFEDAPWDGLGGTPFFQPGDAGRRTPFTLGTPRPTTFQHYLTQPPVDRPNGQPEPAGQDSRTLCNYHHPLGKGPHSLTDQQGNLLAVTDGTVVRGAKRYWHQPQANDRFRFRQDLAKPDERQFTIIRPVRPGTTFKGRVRFENLTEVELGALLTVLQLKPSQRHQLGMGKPFGMGGVRVEATLHLTDRAARYANLFGDDGRVSTGEVAAAEVEQVAARCRQMFEAAVRTHYRATAAGPVSGLTDLWAIPRLRALAALLEWDKAPLLERTGYAPPNVKEDNLSWWRDRRVLPTAELVAGVQEQAPPPPRGPEGPRGPRPERPERGGPRPPKGDREQERPRGRDRDRDRPPPPRRPTYEPGKAVLCVLLEEKTKAGNWKAKIKDSEIVGDVMGSAAGDAEAGKEVSLVIRFYTPPTSASFWWPDSVPKPKGKGKG